MKKKLILLSIAIVSITSALFLTSYNSPATPLSERPCAFCEEQVLLTHKFYEDDLVMALCTHRPVFPGHCLVIPKRHVERFDNLTADEISQIGKVIKIVNLASIRAFETSSYLLLQKNGLESGQSVPHVHFHYIPRQKDDSSSLKFIFKMFMANTGNPISAEEMKSATEKMRVAMDEILEDPITQNNF